MQSHIIVRDVLVKASQIFGGELPEWDDEGFCNVEFDHYSLLLIVDDQEEKLVAVAVFDEFSDGASPQIYFDALRRNFQAIQGPVPQFSLDPENDAICLFNKISTLRPEGEMVDFLEEFLHCAGNYSSEQRFK